MTREEAKKLFWKKGGVFEKTFMYCLDKVLKLPYRGSEVDVFIDRIYDDFESRVCKNCLYYFKETCVCDESPLVTEIVDENYGCNKFERRKKQGAVK